MKPTRFLSRPLLLAKPEPTLRVNLAAHFGRYAAIGSTSIACLFAKCYHYYPEQNGNGELVHI